MLNKADYLSSSLKLLWFIQSMECTFFHGQKTKPIVYSEFSLLWKMEVKENGVFQDYLQLIG